MACAAAFCVLKSKAAGFAVQTTMKTVPLLIPMTACVAAALAMSWMAGSAASESAGSAPVPAPGAGAGAEQEGPHATVRAVAGVDGISPGETFHVAVIFDIKPGWHIYWKNPGEGAAPPEIELRGPDNYQIGGILWPRPDILASTVGDMYIYERQVALFMPVKAPSILMDGEVQFTADVNWAVCDEKVCHLESGRVTVSIKTSTKAKSGTAGEAAAAAKDPVFAAQWKRLPRSIDKVEGAKASLTGSTLTIEAPAQGRTSAKIIPDYSPGVTFGKATILISGDRIKATVPIELKPGNALGKKMSVGGLVALGTGSDGLTYEFSLPVKNP